LARLSDDDNDKVLWLTLAQSWVRLADHVDRTKAGLEISPSSETPHS
jgi:hypothetical protein